MPAFSVVGRDFTTKQYTISTVAQSITTPYPCKSFLIKAVGSGIRMRKTSADAAGDAYIMDDGETLNFDLSLAFPIASSTSTIGYFDTASGSATLYLIVAY